MFMIKRHRRYLIRYNPVVGKARFNKHLTFRAVQACTYFYERHDQI